jgi:hypothetical protein
MESDQEFQSTFSKLNVNAVEFVPNFTSFAAATAKDPEPALEESPKPPIEMTENNGNGKLSVEFQLIMVENFATSNMS